VQRREETGNPIDVKLKQVADELHSVVVAYLQVGNIVSHLLKAHARINVIVIHLKCCLCLNEG